MRLLFYILLLGLAVAAVVWVRQGIYRDRFQNAVKDLVDRQSEETAGPLLAFIQERVPGGLVREWRFFARYFSFRLTWANVWACAARYRLIVPKNLPWENYARQKIKAFFLEAPSELAILKLEKELDDKLVFYLNRVVQTGGGFAIKNCQADIAAILKQRLLEPGADPGLLAADFEEKLGEIMVETGDRMALALAGNPAFKKTRK